MWGRRERWCMVVAAAIVAIGCSGDRSGNEAASGGAREPRSTWAGPFDLTWTDLKTDERSLEDAVLPDAKTQLRALLEPRMSNTRAKAWAARMEDADAIAAVPHPYLRAAVLALAGTYGEPAIDLYLTPVPRRAVLDFDRDITDAGAHIDCGDRHPTVRVRSGSVTAPIAALAPVLAHEAVHTDPSDWYTGLVARDGLISGARVEEHVSVLVEAWVWAQMIDADPSVLDHMDDSHLVRLETGRLLGVLNSERFPEGGFDIADGAGPIDQATGDDNWGSFTMSLYRDDAFVPSVGSELSDEVLSALAGASVPAASSSRFDPVTLAWVSRHAPADHSLPDRVVELLRLTPRPMLVDVEFGTGSAGADDVHDADTQSVGDAVEVQLSVTNRTDSTLKSWYFSVASTTTVFSDRPGTLSVGDETRTISADELRVMDPPGNDAKWGWVTVNDQPLAPGATATFQAEVVVEDSAALHELGIYLFGQVTADGTVTWTDWANLRSESWPTAGSSPRDQRAPSQSGTALCIGP